MKATISKITTQKIKVHNPVGPLQSTQITLKNQVAEINSIQDINDVAEVSLVTGATLVYNATSNLYEIKPLDLGQLSQNEGLIFDGGTF